METNSQCTTTYTLFDLKCLLLTFYLFLLLFWWFFFWSIFLFYCWIKDLLLRKSLSSCFKWDIKGIIKPKNQVFMQNTNFISFWSTRALLDLFFKKLQFIFCWKSEKLDPKNCDFFDWHSFCLYEQYIYKKIVGVTQLDRRYHTVTKRVAVKSRDKNKTVSL